MFSGPRVGVDLMVKEKCHDPFDNRRSFHRLSFTPPSCGSGGSDGGVGGGNDEDDMILMCG
jgi:hypothetical protein